MSEKLLKSTLVVGSMTFLSRILGFIRDVMIARLLGTSIYSDVFFVVFKIPNFLRALFAEGAFSQAFIPVLAEYKKQGDQSLKKLIAETSGTLTVILMVITTIGIIASPIIMMGFAPGFTAQPEKMQMASALLKITFPYLFFISLTALAGSILNSFGRFAVPAFTPVLLNLSLIAAALWIAPNLENPITGLAWGVFIGGMLQLLFQIPFLLQLNKLPMPRWGWKSDGVQKILKLMMPAMLGVSINQLNLLLDTLLASFLMTGSISWLYYSSRLVNFPLGVFGVALSTVILPSLSAKHISKSKQEFSDTIDWALRWVFIIGTPAMIGLITLAVPLLSALFQYGKFDAHTTHQVSLSLIAYAAGLLPVILIKVLAPGFFARQDTKTPVKIGIASIIINMVLNVILMQYLGYIGLALATTISSTFNAGLLYFFLVKRNVYKPAKGWMLFLLKMLVANGALLALLLWVSPDNNVWSTWPWQQRLLHISGLILAAISLYVAMLYLLGFKLKQLLRPN